MVTLFSKGRGYGHLTPLPNRWDTMFVSPLLIFLKLFKLQQLTCTGMYCADTFGMFCKYVDAS